MAIPRNRGLVAVAVAMAIPRNRGFVNRPIRVAVDPSTILSRPRKVCSALTGLVARPFSCKAAFTMRFFPQQTGIVLGTAPDSQDFVFKHTTSACRAFPHISHFCVGLSLTNVEPQHKARFLAESP